MALLVLLLCLAAWQWRLAQSATQRAIMQQASAEAQRDRAEKSESEARSEKAIAQRNLTAAKQAVNSLVYDIAQGFRHVEGISANVIRGILEQSSGTIEQLLAAAPDDPELRISKAGMLEEFAQVYFKLGDFDAALLAAEQGFAIYADLDAHRRDRDLLHRAAIMLNEIGAIEAANGNSANALPTFERAVALLQRAVDFDSRDLTLARDLAIELGMLGAAEAAAGKGKVALDRFVQATEISRVLVERDPDDSELQQVLSFNLTEIGTQRFEDTDYQGAMEAYLDAQKIATQLTQKFPRNTSYQNILFLTLIGLGDCERKRTNSNALERYKTARSIMIKLADSDPTNSQWKNLLRLVEKKISGELYKNK